MASQKHIVKLLQQYSEIVEDLREIIDSRNIVGGYGEYYVCKKLGLQRAPSGQKGYDAKDADGKRYQIKARKENPTNKPTRFVIKRELITDTDFIVYIHFNDDWSVKYLLKIPRRQLKPNGHNVVILKKSIINKFRYEI